MKLRSLDLAVSPLVRGIFGNVAKLTSFATIAGGYLRDSYYQVPHKDIDIFVNSSMRRSELGAAFPGWTISEHDDDEKSYDGVSAFQVINLAHSNYDPVQIMTSDDYNTVESVLDKFDFGFCQIAFDGSNVLVTDEFWNDASNNTATFLMDRNRRSNHSEHENRLRQKYPNLKWV